VDLILAALAWLAIGAALGLAVLLVSVTVDGRWRPH
jgi:hypothetical protein